MIIGLTGENCAGKGTVADYLGKKSFRMLSLSDVIREDLAAEGKEATREGMIARGNELRKKFGASRVSLFGDRLHLVVQSAEEKEQGSAVLREAGVGVLTEKEVPFSLEDVFIALIESRRSEIPL